MTRSSSPRRIYPLLLIQLFSRNGLLIVLKSIKYNEHHLFMPEMNPILFLDWVGAIKLMRENLSLLHNWVKDIRSLALQKYTDEGRNPPPGLGASPPSGGVVRGSSGRRLKINNAPVPRKSRIENVKQVWLMKRNL